MRTPGLAAACAALWWTSTACVSTDSSTYEWAGYKQSIVELSNQPGGADVSGHIVIMTETIAKSRAGGRPIPPGFHAHLAYLYLLEGDLDTAQAAFESEKELYPESAVFIDGVLARLRESQ